MKRPLVPKIINKTNLLDNSLVNERKNINNSILKSNIKSINKRKNYHSNINKLKLDREIFTRQNSYKLIEAIISTRRNYSNKKIFSSNSYKKREKIDTINEKESDKIVINKFKKDVNIKHKKLLSLQTNLINNNKLNKKYYDEKNITNSRVNTNLNNSKLVSTKLKEFYSSLNKEKNLFKNNKKFNKSLYNNDTNTNISINKSNIQHNKILNKSLEQRSKNYKFKLSQNFKLKILKNKKNKKEEEKTENILNKACINKNSSNLNHSQRNKPPSKIEICQTFSKEEHIKDNEKNNNNQNEPNSNINKEEKNIIIDSNFKSNKEKKSFLIPKTSTSKDNKTAFINMEKEIKTPIAFKSVEKYSKLKYLIGECYPNIDNINKYTSISINAKPKKVKNISINNYKYNYINNNFVPKEIKGKKNYIINYDIKKHTHTFYLDILEGNKKIEKKCEKEKKDKNNGIFEVISDIKVKSLNEYEEEKKADSNQKEYNTIPNDNKITNNNININININYNNININNQINKENSINRQYNTERKGCIQDKKNIENNKININNGVFIEDRDEYSIKETFSRDRFSFKPISENNEIVSNYQYNNLVNNKNNNDIKNNINNKTDKISLDKKDFVNNHVINSSILNRFLNKEKTNNKNIGVKKIMKKEISKIQKLKKIIKNKQTSKLLKPENSLNKSVELRFKKNK